MGRSVNYFENLGVECHFPKIGYSEYSFPKKRSCQCSLSNKKIKYTITISLMDYLSHV